MALPLKSNQNWSEASHPQVPQEEPESKIIGIESYDPARDLADLASDEAEVVVSRAFDAAANPSGALHELGERATGAYDSMMQKAVGAGRRGVFVLRNLSEEDPIRFIALVGAAAFVLGFMLRIGRSTRG